jgi:hypothetical protein
MPIWPGFRILWIALPDLNILGKLADQHNLLDRWTMLIGFELATPVASWA